MKTGAGQGENRGTVYVYGPFGYRIDSMEISATLERRGQCDLV